MGGHYTQRQAVAAVLAYKAGMPADAICRRHGISRRTLLSWTARVDRAHVSDGRLLQRLEEENRCLRRQLADAILMVAALRGELS